MLEFLRRNRLLTTTAAFLLLAATLIVRSGGSRLRDDRVGALLLEVVAPAQRVATRATRAVVDAWEGVEGLWRARVEADALRARVQELERQAARLTEIELENTRLRQLLDFRQTLAGQLLTARIIGHDATGLSRTIAIDQGTAAGVARGAAVLAPGGLVGQVILVSPHAARVMLVTDHNSGVDAVVQRTRGRGIVEGTADGRCGLKFVKRTEDLQLGDLVLSSGLEGIFPRGLPIGRIVEVDKQGQGLFQYAQIEPAVDMDALEEVLVTLGPVAPAPPELEAETPPAG
jgi:rod shape-determining protein MreC